MLQRRNSAGGGEGVVDGRKENKWKGLISFFLAGGGGGEKKYRKAEYV